MTIPASFFWLFALGAAGVVFGAGGVVWQVHSFGNRLAKNDDWRLEHVEGHAPKIAGASNGEDES